MPQRFSPAADRRLRWIALAVLLGAALLLGAGIYRSNLAAAEGVGAKVEQPIPFSHKQHVETVGLDCATCHATADASAHAGMPDVETCLTCHAELFRGTEALQPLHEAEAAGREIEWNAVTRLPDVARFHHGAHVRAGVTCATCHGDIEGMERTSKVRPLTMDWCVDCHRSAQSRAEDFAIRPVSRWHRDLTDCSVCHY